MVLSRIKCFLGDSIGYDERSTQNGTAVPLSTSLPHDEIRAKCHSDELQAKNLLLNIRNRP
jgi:hypothetical protein